MALGNFGALESRVEGLQKSLGVSPFKQKKGLNMYNADIKITRRNTAQDH